jgi:DNA processing protein
VFALPANVDSDASVGSLRLLRDGAIPLLSSDDVVHEYIDLFPDKIDVGKQREMVPIDSAVEKKLLDSQIKDAKTRPDTTKKGIDNVPAREYIDLNKLIETLPENERKVAIAIKDLGGANAHADEIILKSGLTPGEALAALTILQIKGYAVQSSGKYFSLEAPE